jgi:hypothetical protein
VAAAWHATTEKGWLADCLMAMLSYSLLHLLMQTQLVHRALL